MRLVSQSTLDPRSVMASLSVRRRTLIDWRDGWLRALLNSNAALSGRARVR